MKMYFSENNNKQITPPFYITRQTTNKTPYNNNLFKNIFERTIGNPCSSCGGAK